jgi:hypothetical protein
MIGHRNIKCKAIRDKKGGDKHRKGMKAMKKKLIFSRDF